MNTIPTQQQYEQHEAAEFHRQLNQSATLTPAERDECYAAFLDNMQNEKRDGIIAERISWLLNGSYGYGSYKVACKVAANTRMNRAAWMVQTIGAVEWMVSQAQVVKAWKSLTKAQQDTLNAAVMAEVKYHLDQQAEQAA